jgi:hypothetical protein
MTRTIGWAATILALTFGCAQAPNTPPKVSDAPISTTPPVTSAMPVSRPRNLPLAELRQEFDATDLNGDGVITRSEYGKAFAGTDHETMMMREAAYRVNVDLNADGRVDWEEYQQADRQMPKLVLPPAGTGEHMMM